MCVKVCEIEYPFVSIYVKCMKVSDKNCERYTVISPLQQKLHITRLCSTPITVGCFQFSSSLRRLSRYCWSRVQRVIDNRWFLPIQLCASSVEPVY